jgi:preprotein translocase subunit SecG
MDESTNSTNSPNTVSSGLGTIANNTYDYVNSLLSNPTLIIILVIIVIIYLIVFLSLGGEKDGETNFGTSSQDVSNSSSTAITVILIAFFIILIVINGVQYFFGIDIIAQIKNLFTGNPEVDITVNNPAPANSVTPDLVTRLQVFNIPGNNYVYPDAKALCAAYGARLATYQEVENTYNEGGEWCNYGWSEGQMALFPTQEKTWNNLQKIEGHENDCGRPGVNGGFIANPAVKFGVNCYGIKPRINSTEEDLMANEPIYPKTLKDIAMENRVNYWKDKLSQILVSPFNHESWSKL